MKLFAASLQTESNTFAPWPTGRGGFEDQGVQHGDEARRGTRPEHLTANLWRTCCERDGHAFTAGLFAYAKPSGPTVHAVYEAFRDDILEQARRDGPFDMVLLFLHGAMVSTECDDCEGDLLARLRGIVGAKAVIGVELDPHCHLSEAMIAHADVVICMKHYPHDDFLERGQELYDLCLATLEGRVRPVPALFDCRMVGFFRTTEAPMTEVVRQLQDAESTPGVLSVSFAHGFPWGDTPSTGSRVLAYADGDEGLAGTTAARLGREIYARRNALLPRFPSASDALDRALAAPGVKVLADTADNAGGGAPSDNVALLREMLARRVTDAALGAIWDPVVARTCEAAGVGTELMLRLGGKCGPASGDPMDVSAKVRGVRENHHQGGLGTSRVSLGLSAWIEIGGVDVVVTSLRDQVFAPDAFTGLGIDLAAKTLIAVKSSQHFQAGFAPLADEIIWVATPGAIQMDFASIPYRKKADLDFHPRRPDPLGLDGRP